MTPHELSAVVTGGLIHLRSRMATGSKMASDCDTVLDAAWHVDACLHALQSENEELRARLGGVPHADR